MRTSLIVGWNGQIDGWPPPIWGPLFTTGCTTQSQVRHGATREIHNATRFRVATFTRTTPPFHEMPTTTPARTSSLSLPTATIRRKFFRVGKVLMQSSATTCLHTLPRPTTKHTSTTSRADRLWNMGQPIEPALFCFCSSAPRSLKMDRQFWGGTLTVRKRMAETH